MWAGPHRVMEKGAFDCKECRSVAEQHRGQIAAYAAYSIIILTLDAHAQEQDQQCPSPQ